MSRKIVQTLLESIVDKEIEVRTATSKGRDVSTAVFTLYELKQDLQDICVGWSTSTVPEKEGWMTSQQYNTLVRIWEDWINFAWLTRQSQHKRWTTNTSPLDPVDVFDWIKWKTLYEQRKTLDGLKRQYELLQGLKH